MGSIELRLHQDRSEYPVESEIRPQLQIQNDSIMPASVGAGFRFDWERAAFVEPNEIHLVVGGVDLAGPYGREQIDPANAPPLLVAPGDSAWQYLPISSHWHLQDPGPYEFWIALENSGDAIQSNHLEFRMTPAETNAPPGDIQLHLSAPPSINGDGASDEVTATFVSNSDRPWTLLRPQHDSFYGWVNPVYRFTVVDQHGRMLSLGPRSGTMASPLYTPEMRVTLQPHGSLEERLTLPRFNGVNDGERYRIRLTYLVRPLAIGKGGVVLDTDAGWSSDVFIGRVQTKDVTVEGRRGP